jgi:hypothetical protein
MHADQRAAVWMQALAQMIDIGSSGHGSLLAFKALSTLCEPIDGIAP